MWGEVGRAVRDGALLGEAWEARLVAHLTWLPSCEAEVLYVDLCKIHLASTEEIAPTLNVLDWVVDATDVQALRRFCSLVIEHGRVVDLVADCIELRPGVERQRRWDAAAAERSRRAAQHRRNSDALAQFSAFSVRARAEHRAAYEAVRRSLATHADRDTVVWKQVVGWTPERLARCDRSFWYALQTAKCATAEKQAVCHKLGVCQPLSRCPADVGAHRAALMQQLFHADGKPPRRRRRCWLMRAALSRLRRPMRFATVDRSPRAA